MSATIITTHPPRKSTSTTTVQEEPTDYASLGYDVIYPTDQPVSSEEDPFLSELGTAVPTTSATDTPRTTDTPSTTDAPSTANIPSAAATDVSVDPETTTPAAAFSQICTVDSDCASHRVCTNRICVSINNAAPLGGPGSGPTSHLTAGSAVGVGVGILAMIALLVAAGILFWRVRGRRTRNESIETPSIIHNRSFSTATKWTVEPDQKTLVASMPNSPRNARLRQHPAMPPEFFAKALDFNDSGQEKTEYRRLTEYRRPEPLDDVAEPRAVTTERALPLPPPLPLPPLPLPTENPLPPAPIEKTRYAVNVNIDKSMIMDDEMIRTVSPNLDNGAFRERAPRYRFEEYLPPVATVPPLSIVRRPASSVRSSEYELERYPKSRRLSGDSTESSGPQYTRESKAPQLSAYELPLPLPSPSFSFRNYDWYQEIIGEQPNAELSTPTEQSHNYLRTSTQATSPSLPSPSLELLDFTSSLFPEPPSQVASPQSAAFHLHPKAAALPSPTNANFKLLPTVYQMPSQLPKLPPMPPKPPTPPPKSRVSVLSTMTRKTHNSRSWLPEDGLYLPEEGTMDSYKRFRRPSDASKPTTYSPLG